MRVTAPNRAIRWAVTLAAGLIVLVLPRPAGVSPQGWHLLAIFVATVVGLIAQPVAMGGIALLAVAFAGLTKTVSVEMAFSAYASPVIWLIVAAFLFSRSVMKAGLGRRIAFLFIRRFGTSPLRLGYALAGADLVFSPFIPSDTARAGGIIFPIARSLAESYDSHPGPTAQRLGAYLMQCAYHVGCMTAAIFLTSMVANPLAAKFAKDIANVNLTWNLWALASCVPAAISMSLLPWLIFRLDRPELRSTPEAPAMAQKELLALGPMSRAEISLVIILLAVIAGWVTQAWHGVHPAIIALSGVSLIILSGVIGWDEVVKEHRAWDALLWFGSLIMMASGLNQLGVIKAFSDELSSHLHGLSPLAALVVLVLIYTYAHFGFASMTAHITALYPAFLLLAVANGAPALVTALALAFFSNLNASLTHYGTGPAPIFFGSGYVSQLTWWRVGFVVVLFHLAVWLGLGLLWWRLLGLW